MSAQILTPSEVAERYGVSTATVLRAIRKGHLTATKIGRRAYIIKADHARIYAEYVEWPGAGA